MLQALSTNSHPSTFGFELSIPSANKFSILNRSKVYCCQPKQE